MRPIDIDPADLETVRHLLHELTPELEVRAFGSRVSWTARETSDLDLALMTTEPLDIGRMAALKAAFTESDLPFRVDIVDWASTSESFRKVIEIEYVVLPRADKQDTGGEQMFCSLPDDWEQTTLGIACGRGGGVQTGPFGSQLHASDYVSVGIPSIMPRNIGDNRIDENGIARISPDDARRLDRHVVRAGDIVYSRRGDVERRALVRTLEAGWLCGTECLRVRFDDNGVNPQYASYFLGHPHIREWIVRHAHGATMPSLNTSILSACPFVIPPPPEQRAIAHILGTLDDRIELNRRMNETLDAVTQALFKSWFVDFEPVRAKMAGRETEFTEDLNRLFPAVLDVEGAPLGWTKTSLTEVASFTRGRSYRSAELRQSDVALVTLESFERGGGYRPEGLKPYTGTFKPEQVIDPGELVIALSDVTQATDVIGKPAVVLRTEQCDVLVASFDVGIVRPLRQHIGKTFLYNLMSTEQFQAHIRAHCTGTTVLHLSKEAFPSYSFRLPTAAVLAAFNRVTEPLAFRMAQLHAESRALVRTRDALLPKLVSGEIRLNQAEAAIPAFS